MSRKPGDEPLGSWALDLVTGRAGPPFTVVTGALSNTGLAFAEGGREQPALVRDLLARRVVEGDRCHLGRSGPEPACRP